MGNALSGLEKTQHKDGGFSMHVFRKETDMVNELLNKILSKDDSFSDPELNLTSNEICKDYIFVLENSLRNHLKVELKDLNQNILLIPNGENQAVKKAELCTLVTDHYNSILQVILLLKNVFDLENDGNNSILGICIQLIKIEKDTFTIYYCDSSQGGQGTQGGQGGQGGESENENENGNTSGTTRKTRKTKKTKKKENNDEKKKIDITELKGLKMLFDHFLDEHESKILVSNFTDILQYDIEAKDENIKDPLPPYEMELTLKAKRSRKKFVDAMLCGDNLMTPEQYENIFAHQSGKQCNRITAFNRRKQYEGMKNSTKIVIQGRNPIFAPYCSSQRMHTIDLSKISATQVSQLKQMYTVMHQDYTENMNSTFALLKEIVVFDKKRNYFTIRHLSAQSLANIKMRVKTQVIQFYLRSLINYQNILDFALSM